jgi:hypothetical protein
MGEKYFEWAGFELPVEEDAGGLFGGHEVKIPNRGPKFVGGLLVESGVFFFFCILSMKKKNLFEPSGPLCL